MENFSFIAAMVIWGLVLALSLIAIILRLTGIFPSFLGESYRRIQMGLAGLGLAFLTMSIISRAVVTGHGPFSNMYEFSVAFSWGIVAMSLLFIWRYRIISVGIVAIAIAEGLLLFANTLSSRPTHLVPALQQNYLLTAHVAAAVIAYGALTVSFVAALFYLIQTRGTISWVPKPDILDDMSYHAVIIGFPFMTLLIVLGALWADIAWGRYWSWDPKETASLVTWLLYAGYLHSRVMRGWRGIRSAILLIVGFAAVLFTFFGNYIFTGLHSYQ